MGNTIRRFCCEGFTLEAEQSNGISGNAHRYEPPLAPHGVSTETAGHAALARDLLQFEVTGQVPFGLSNYVGSSRAAQKKLYENLLKAWKTARPPPSNAREASLLVLQNVQGLSKTDIEGILSFYGLPSSAPSLSSSSVYVDIPDPTVTTATGKRQGVQYEMETLAADSYAAVDGDTLDVYVDTNDDSQEAIPHDVQETIERRRKAREQRNYKAADALQKQISKAGYKVFDSKNGDEEIIARRYKIRLRGVDAPENSQPYGPESKAMLQSIVNGKPLRLRVYDVDQYGRIVADVHCSQGFVQEILLKKGGCWHYIAYDKRPEFAKWELGARKRRLGLWKDDNPEKPWDYRKNHNRDGTPKGLTK